jgi:hypothetical protein
MSLIPFGFTTGSKNAMEGVLEDSSTRGMTEASRIACNGKKWHHITRGRCVA